MNRSKSKYDEDLYGEAREVNARTDDPLVVVGVHAHRVRLQVEGVLTVFYLDTRTNIFWFCCFVA
jgi:hypothetical protein